MPLIQQKPSITTEKLFFAAVSLPNHKSTHTLKQLETETLIINLKQLSDDKNNIF